jgi:hypothetical protein
MTIDWAYIRNVALAISAVVGVLLALPKLFGLFRKSKGQPLPEHRTLANDLLDVSLQVQRLIKKRRQPQYDPKLIQPELDTQSDRADELFRRARTEFGPRIDGLKAAIVACTNDFRWATEQMDNLDRSHDRERVIKECGPIARTGISGDGSDEFSQKLQTAVSNLEDFLRPYIGR